MATRAKRCTAGARIRSSVILVLLRPRPGVVRGRWADVEHVFRRRGYSFGRKMKRRRAGLTSARGTRHCPWSSRPGGSSFPSPRIRFSTMQKHSRFNAYGLAMLATAPVLLVHLAAWSVPAPVMALLLAAAVVTSAWVGGLVAGLLSTVLIGLVVLPSGLSPEVEAAGSAGRLTLP